MDTLSAVFSVAAGLMVLFILLPLAMTLLGTPLPSVVEALGNGEVQGSVLLTFSAGMMATLLGAVTGVPLAYLLARRRFSGKRLVEGLVDLPIVVPHTAAGIALLMVFGSRGVLGGPLEAIGITFVDTMPGITVAMMFVSVPFLINTTREAFVNVDPEIERMAESLGANRWLAFTYVTLPLAWRGLVAGALMMWARGISEFGAVVMLAYHPKIVPVLVYERFQGFGLDAAKPVAVLLIVASVAVFSLLRILLLPGEENQAPDPRW